MRLLTNYIGGINGGINRRVYELERFVNSAENTAGHTLTAVGMGSRAELGCQARGAVKVFSLPRQEWQSINPGSESAVAPQLASFPAFLECVAPTVKAIQRIIETEKIDVCCAQSAFYSPWTVIAAAHNCGVPCVQLYCGSAQTEIFDEALRTAYLPIECRFAELASRTVFNSRFAKRIVEERLGRSFPGAGVIYNGFPAELGGLADSYPGRTVAGWVGREAAVKNIDYLFALRAKIPPRIEFKMLTNLEGEKAARLRREGIVIENSVHPSAVYGFYAGVTCAISTSFFEFFPNVIAEALAAGRMPLVPETSGIAEVLRERGLEEAVVDLGDLDLVAGRIAEAPRFLPRVRKAAEELRRELPWPRVIALYFGEFAKVLT